MFEPLSTDRQRRHIAVLFAGPWEERDVSIDSAREVVPALRARGHRVRPLRWDSEGWVDLDALEDLVAPGRAQPVLEAVHALQAVEVDVVFSVLHGGPGEGGSVAGLLELAGIPHTGAGVAGSAITLDKDHFRRWVMSRGLDVAAGRTIGSDDPESETRRVIAELGLPLVLKPLRSGSSCGVEILRDASLLETRLALRDEEERILVEAFVEGREFSVGCLRSASKQGAEVIPLPVIEIEPLTGSGFFDIDAKYTAGGARETVPADLPEARSSELQEIARSIHHELDLGPMSRTDFIVAGDQSFVLETNTVPGFTAGSLLPQCAAAAGLDFGALCTYVVEATLARHRSRRSGLSAASTNPEVQE